MTPDEQRAYVEARFPEDLPKEATFARFDIVDQFGEVNWSAAYNFTVAHEQEIAWVREEIALIEYIQTTYYWCEEEPQTIARLLAKAEAELQGLLRGYREVKE